MESYLVHHGIKGQKWGIRRYQNDDGTLTEAGKKHYGYDLDINDTSRSNIAKIRLGEAKRRLDNAKLNNAGVMEKLKLKANVKAAKKAVKFGKQYDQGEAKALEGQTISGNRLKTWAAVGAATLASAGFNVFMDSRMDALKSDGRYTEGHQFVADLLKMGVESAGSLATLAYSAKKESDNQKLRVYNRSQWDGSKAIKRVGGQEYADRKKELKKNK